MKIFPKGLDQQCAFVVSSFTILCGLAAVIGGCIEHSWPPIAAGFVMAGYNIYLPWQHRDWLWPDQMRRVRSRRRRHAKERFDVWMPRWERACKRHWRILWSNPPSEQLMRRCERNMKRLCNVYPAGHKPKQNP